MTKPYQSKVSSKYGAPMGRASYPIVAGSPLHLDKVPMVDGDYDQGGAYWGGGNPAVYCAWSDDGESGPHYFRATSRENAMSKLAKAFAPITLTFTSDTPDLESFFESYISCALWSTNDESTEAGGEPFDANYSASDFNRHCLAQLKKECAAFIEENAETLKGLDASQAGHDFWLTRNGHGAGFWDGDYEKAIGERLTKSSERYGTAHLYLHRKRIYAMGYEKPRKTA